MRVYVAVVPPDDHAAKIQSFAETIAAPNIRPDPSSGPHITLRAPQEIDDTDVWVKNIAAAAENFEPFQVKLTHAISFGLSVLALSARGRSLGQINRHFRQFLRPYDDDPSQNIRSAFTPHLIIAHCGGLSEEEMAGLLRLSEENLLSLPGFSAEELTVFGRQKDASRYDVIARIPLAVKSIT